jgi:hypothetical protein
MTQLLTGKIGCVWLQIWVSYYNIIKRCLLHLLWSLLQIGSKPVHNELHCGPKNDIIAPDGAGVVLPQAELKLPDREAQLGLIDER